MRGTVVEGGVVAAVPLRRHDAPAPTDAVVHARVVIPTPRRHPPLRMKTPTHSTAGGSVYGAPPGPHVGRVGEWTRGVGCRRGWSITRPHSFGNSRRDTSARWSCPRSTCLLESPSSRTHSPYCSTLRGRETFGTTGPTVLGSGDPSQDPSPTTTTEGLSPGETLESPVSR